MATWCLRATLNWLNTIFQKTQAQLQIKLNKEQKMRRRND